MVALDTIIVVTQFYRRILFHSVRNLVCRYVSYKRLTGVSKKYFKSWGLSHFIIVQRLVEEIRASAGVFSIDVLLIARHVFTDIKRQSVDVLFVT